MREERFKGGGGGGRILEKNGKEGEMRGRGGEEESMGGNQKIRGRGERKRKEEGKGGEKKRVIIERVERGGVVGGI